MWDLIAIDSAQRYETNWPKTTAKEPKRQLDYLGIEVQVHDPPKIGGLNPVFKMVGLLL